MHVRCPHCHNPVEILDDSSFKDIACSTCGSNFSLVGGTDATQTTQHEAKTIGQFELVEQLGAGAFGTVWKAEDTQLDRMVAIKIPRKGQLSEDETEKFLREARAAAQLRHPNIVSVHEVGKSDDSVYIVSDYVEGADLKEWLRGEPLPSKEAADLCAKIAEALHHAHEHGVIHRDLKPGNIMMDLTGQPHIMDFGLAKRESGEMTMTVDGAILGTPAYMSPEQAKGKGHEADRRSDVYSLGTMLFEMLTGELPFRGEKRMLIVSILTEEPPKLRRLNPRVPKDLETICLKCLEKEPGRRYATAMELADDLRRYAIGEPIAARAVGVFEHAWRWTRNHPTLAGLVAVSVVAVIASLGGGISFVYQRRLGEANDQLSQSLARETKALTVEQELTSELEHARSRLGQSLYFMQIAQAHSAWDDDQVVLCKRLLELCEDEQKGWEWHYLDGILQHDTTILGDSGRYVMDVSVSPDGSRLASANLDNTVSVWDLASKEELFRFPGDPTLFDGKDPDNANRYGFYSVAFGPEGRLLAAGAGNQRATTDEGRRRYSTITIWDLDTGKLVRTIKGHTGPVSWLAFNHDGGHLASRGGGNLRYWDIRTGVQKFSIAGGPFTFGVDGNLAGVSGGTLSIFSAQSGETIRTLDGLVTSSMSVALSPNNEQVASCGADTYARVWDVSSGTQRFAFPHATTVDVVAFSPDGKLLATAGHDMILRVWDLRNGALVRKLKGHTDVIQSIEFTPDGQGIVSASRDTTVRVWGSEAGQICRSFEEEDDVVVAAFAQEGSRVVSRRSDGRISIRDAASGDLLKSDFGDAMSLYRAAISNRLAISTDGLFVAGGNEDHTVRIWDATSGRETRVLRTPEPEGRVGQVLAIGFHPGGELIAIGLRGTTAEVWNVDEAELVYRLPHDGVTCTAFSPDGKSIATGSFDNTVRIWETSSGKAVQSLGGFKHMLPRQQNWWASSCSGSRPSS